MRAQSKHRASRAKNAPKAKKGAKRAKATAKKAKKAASAPRPNTKKAVVLGLLRRRRSPLAELMAATAWQAHSIRGFVSGTVGKRLGLPVESSRDSGGERVYKLGN